MTVSVKRTPKTADPYASLYRLVDPDDHATREWIRTCSWSPEAKREYLLEERKAGIKEAMACAHTKQIAELTHRISRLERNQIKMERALLDGLAKAMVQVIKDYGCMTFKGTFDEDLQYTKGSVVVHNGATWVAIAPTIKGGRPGRAPEWKLTAKGEGR